MELLHLLQAKFLHGVSTPQRCLASKVGGLLRFHVEMDMHCSPAKCYAPLGLAGLADDGADPATLERVTKGDVVACAAGFDHAVIVTSAEGPRVFGPAYTPAGIKGLYLTSISVPVSIISVSAGEHHTLLLSAAGDVYAFGSNREGQLGTSTGGTERGPDASVVAVGPAVGTAAIKAIAAGARHSLAITESGQVLGWGWSLHGP